MGSVVAPVVLTRGKKTPNHKKTKMADADAVKKVCEIYDWDGKGQLDMIYLMDVVKLVNEAIKAPESSGTYHDYVELCKLYDKNENGTMMLAELENVLSNLADEIPKED